MLQWCLLSLFVEDWAETGSSGSSLADDGGGGDKDAEQDGSDEMEASDTLSDIATPVTKPKKVKEQKTEIQKKIHVNIVFIGHVGKFCPSFKKSKCLPYIFLWRIYL